MPKRCFYFQFLPDKNSSTSITLAREKIYSTEEAPELRVCLANNADRRAATRANFKFAPPVGVAGLVPFLGEKISFRLPLKAPLRTPAFYDPARGPSQYLPKEIQKSLRTSPEADCLPSSAFLQSIFFSRPSPPGAVSSSSTSSNISARREGFRERCLAR